MTTSATTYDLYVVPEDQWTAINRRVGLTVLAGGIGDVVDHVLAQFGELLRQSKIWQSHTFPGLLDDATSAAQLATAAHRDLGSIAAQLGSFPTSTTDLPAALAADAAAAIGRIHDGATALASSATALSDLVFAFRTINIAIDGELLALQGSLGPLWAPVGDSIVAIENALGSVTGRWGAIASDLADVVNHAVPLTLPFVAGLVIDSELDDWASLANEATAFAAYGPSQTGYMDGTNLGTVA